MPITQDRMIRLVQAAEQTIAQLEGLKSALRKVLNDPEADLATAVLGCIDSGFYQPSTDAVRRIAGERAHYELTHHRNNLNAAKRRKQRGQDPYTPRLEGSPYDTRSKPLPATAEQWTIDDASEPAYVAPDLDAIAKVANELQGNVPNVAGELSLDVLDEKTDKSTS